MSDVFTKIVHHDLDKEVQIRLTINEFRDVEYLHLRKYYRDFETEEWVPSKEGVSMPVSFENCRNLFVGLSEILSLAESDAIIEKYFGDIISK